MKNPKLSRPVDVTIIGGGMITNDLLLPSVYHLQKVVGFREFVGEDFWGEKGC